MATLGGFTLLRGWKMHRKNWRYSSARDKPAKEVLIPVGYLLETEWMKEAERPVKVPPRSHALARTIELRAGRRWGRDEEAQ